MSSNLMDTEAGGESGQYEGDLGLQDAHSKSGGQLGSAETTTNPSDTPEAQQASAERGARNAENIRYGQTLSEQGGVGGMTQGQQGTTETEGFGGGVGDKTADGQSVDAAQGRREQGYGGTDGHDKDQNREIGA